MTLDEARELVNGPLWPKVREDYLASGEFRVFPVGDVRRLAYLEKPVREAVELWLKAIPQIAAWRRVIDGKTVRQLRADYPGVYPEILRYEAYFRGGVPPPERNAASPSPDKRQDAASPSPDKRQDAASPNNGVLKTLLKIKFPEAYRLCYS